MHNSNQQNLIQDQDSKQLEYVKENIEMQCNVSSFRQAFRLDGQSGLRMYPAVCLLTPEANFCEQRLVVIKMLTRTLVW